MRFAAVSLALATLSTTALAACPFGELAKRELVDPEMSARYMRGEGLGDPSHTDISKRDLGGNGSPSDAKDAPPLLDPLSGPLSGLGLGALVPRSEEHKREVYEHVSRRLDERDEDVNMNAKVLTPKAHKRYHEERGLVGGILAPLSGVLQHLDIPTPQESGLRAIPGDDPNHQYQAPGPSDVRGNCPTLNTLANHGYLSR